MDSMTQLEGRVRTLETSLRRSRLLAFMLGLAVVLITGVYYLPEASDDDGRAASTVGTVMVPQAQDVVTTERLVLTKGSDESSVVLVAGPESSLVIQTPAGEEVLRLGGPAGRRIRH